MRVKCGEMMATVSSTLKMFDAMSGPMMRIASSMNLVLHTFEQMQNVTERNENVSRMLVAAKTQISSAEAEIKRQIEQSEKMQKQFNSAVKQGKSNADGLLRSIKNVASVYISFRGMQSGMRVADEYVNTMTRLNIINDGLQTTAELQDKIFAAAGRARGLYTDMAGAVSKMGLLAGHSFSSNDEIIAFTELMQKSFAVSGADTVAQQSAMLQLTQAMAAGRLQGDEFISILENAPMLAQAIAQYTGVGMQGLKELASDGAITSDIIKAALFTAADDINAKFNEIPRTFGATWNEIVNNAMRQFAPFIERISDMLNNPRIMQGIGSLGAVFGAAAIAAIYLFSAIGNVYSFISDNWSLIAPIMWGIVAAMIAYKTIALVSAAATSIKSFALAIQTQGLRAATAAQWGLNAAMLASPITWVALGLIALVSIVYLVVAAINRFAGTSISATGVIAGAFAFLGAFIWNTVIGVINAVIQALWTNFVEPWIGIIEWVLNVFNGGFNSFGDAVKNLLGQIISWFLSLGKVVTKIIDAIFGTNWTAGLESLQDSVLKWGKNEQAITLSREAPMIDARINYGDAWKAGYAWGDELFSGFDNLTKSLDNAANTFDFGHIATVNEVGKIRDKVDISSEDLKMMRELAEMKNIQNFVSLTPTVTVQTGDINNGMDIETIVANITDRLETQIATSARGVYNV